MCCCGKPVVNGEFGYKWQLNDAPSIRKPYPPEMQDGDVLLCDEPGRCGGVDRHCHHFRIVKWMSSAYLLVMHGGGQERMRLPHGIAATLAKLDSNERYSVLWSLHSMYSDGQTTGRDTEQATWRKAAAEKRIKTRKLPARGAVKVWIEPEAQA